MNIGDAANRIVALEKELAEAREQLKGHATLLGTILSGGMDDIRTSELERHPGTGLTKKIRSSRRIVLSAKKVLVDREHVERIAKAIEAAVRYAERAERKAEGARALAADLVVALRELGPAHGFSVQIENDRATVVKDPGSAQSFKVARCTLEKLAQDAADRLELQVREGITRVLTEDGEMMRAALRAELKARLDQRLPNLAAEFHDDSSVKPA